MFKARFKFMAKKIIFGCEARGDAQSPYLIRWTLIETPLGAIYLHKFIRSDSPEHHDHPWAFASLILWRGYIEETAWPYERDYEQADWKRYHRLISIGLTRKLTTAENDELKPLEDLAQECDDHEGLANPRKRMRPGMILLRKATHRHRVVLVDEKPSVTLVIRGPYVREWGFWTRNGWQRWKEYFQERGC